MIFSTIIIDHDVSRIIDLCFPSIAAMKIWVGDLNKEEKKKCIFRYLLWKWSIYFERLNNNISYGFNILYVLIRHTTELQTLNKMKFTGDFILDTKETLDAERGRRRSIFVWNCESRSESNMNV